MKNHRITITAKEHEPLDLDTFVSALLALAIARVAQERAQADTPEESRA